MHPEANVKVDKWIGATGTYFQAYLRRALNNLRADDPDVTAAENGPPLTPATRESFEVEMASDVRKDILMVC